MILEENIEEIYSYSKDFGINPDQIKKSISETSEKLGVSEEEVSREILNHIHDIQTECISQAEKHHMKLKPYQELAVKHMFTHRGMVAAFQTGTGKTLLAVTTAACVLRMAEFLNKEIKVIVITPTSLQENFKKEMRNYGSDPNDSRYTFYTTAKFGIEYKAGKINCSKTFFIVDEAHVFRTDYRKVFSGSKANISDEDTRAEFAIMCAEKAWKVLLLTATPIYNRVYDIVNLVSMIKGVNPPFDENPYEIMENDPELFKDRYGDIILFQESDRTKKDYPEREDILVKIIMTPEYLRRYEELEKKIKKGMLIDDEGEKTTNAFMVKLRSASNQLGICIKCDIVMKIIELGEKTVFFSEFRSSGTDIIVELLKEKGIDYYIITGSTNIYQRKNIVENFNSDNGHKLLIITKAGSEGLDLKGVRNVIIFEQGWNISGAEQVIGRAVRYKSHVHLPPQEQLVRVWHILAVKPYGVEIEKLLKGKKVPFKKKITLNKEYAQDFQVSKNLNKSDIVRIFGADAYMFVQSVEKQEQNLELENELRKIQVGIEK